MHNGCFFVFKIEFLIFKGCNFSLQLKFSAYVVVRKLFSSTQRGSEMAQEREKDEALTGKPCRLNLSPWYQTAHELSSYWVIAPFSRSSSIRGFLLSSTASCYLYPLSWTHVWCSWTSLMNKTRNLLNRIRLDASLYVSYLKRDLLHSVYLYKKNTILLWTYEEYLDFEFGEENVWTYNNKLNGFCTMIIVDLDWSDG